MNPTTPPPASDEAAALYAARHEAARAEVARLQARHRTLGSVRLLWALLGVFLVWLGYRHRIERWEWLLLPLAGFAVTTRIHARVLARSAAGSRAIRLYQHGLARIGERWSGLHPRKPRVDAEASLYAADLDLFRPGGLFELLCTARTAPGEDTLAAWLLQPASPAEVAARQVAVADLRAAHTLREELATLPGPPLLRLPDTLGDWGASTASPLPVTLRWLAPLLVGLTLAASVFWVLTHSWLPLAVLVLVNWALTQRLQTALQPLFGAAQETARDLRAAGPLFAALEAWSFAPGTEAARLQSQLRQDATAGATAASTAVRHLGRLALAAEQRANDFVRLFDILFLYSVLLGLLIQAWRTRFGPRLRPWLAALGSLEALLSLATYHFEHPGDPFPTLAGPAPAFAATGLGHPLLPADGGVRNNVTLNDGNRLLLISGSNMSGKSTLLRAVGTAVVMAMAGAPVRAHALRLSPLHLAASMEVHDSLLAGHSRFYAEILRLRAISALARSAPPVLFLLDELLAGTNSHDRLAGATGIVEALLAAGALGLLSTHDLALTGIDATAGSTIRNMHFEDTVLDDRMVFDYHLREGIVERSNGVALMRMIGLEV